MESIYLDNAATTKVDENVMKNLHGILSECYGNPSSLHHLGRIAREKLEESRKKIADFFGAKPSEIIFTSGGTESNNLALRGLAKANPDKKHIITSEIEHLSILETCKDLESAGYEIEYIGVDKEGIIKVEDIEKKIKKDTLVVSVMHVNNEIGTIQPIEKIGEICKKKKIYFHTDAIQSFNKIDIDVSKMNIDLMSVSAHKFEAPRGIGFLYIRNGTNISPILTGGGQERNLRSGTENLPGIVGIAEALEIKKDKGKIRQMRDKMLDEILEIPGTKLNGSREKRIYNNINISFYGIEGESLMLNLDRDGICVSTGSACASNKLQESHVLKAIGVDEMYMHGSIRITINELTEDEAKFVIRKVKEAVEKLRMMSPFKLNIEVNTHGK